MSDTAAGRRPDAGATPTGPAPNGREHVARIDASEETPAPGTPRLAPPSDADRYARVRALFDTLAERSAAERAAALARVRADAPWLADEVTSLLAAHDAADAGFLGDPAVAAAARAIAGGRATRDPSSGTATDATPSLDGGDGAGTLVGQRLGVWMLEREVGHGGMGAVYRARRADGAFAQQVAVKVIRRGLDTDALVARFERERQILAGFEHPHIARLLDGGAAPDGRPYLVMEFIAGEPLDVWCARHARDVRARLALFLAVCDAVRYAHQRLVVHCDLKPGNVLVTADGTPKLLDFGLARLLDSENDVRSLATGPGLRAMTPEYASPEQVRGEPASTLSDVYSLGVMLYELVAGRRPYGFTSRSPVEVARVVGEREPDSLATSRTADAPPLGRADAAELDVIVATAMHKDAARRYASVEALADDVRRFLERRPLRARRDGWRYRAGRFVRRHRAGVAAGALVVASLVGGLGVATWQARVAERERVRAERERAVAERRFAEVRRLANALLFEVHDAVAPLAGSTPVRALVVRRAVEYLEGLTRGGAATDPALARELATGYLRIGEIQGNSYFSNLGQTASAESSYAHARALAERAAAATPGDTASRRVLASAHLGVGDMHFGASRLREALASYSAAERLHLQLVAARPRDAGYQRLLAAARVRAGDVTGNEGYANLGDPAGALRLYAGAEAALAAALDAAPADSEPVQALLANVLSRRGFVEQSTGEAGQAATTLARAAATFDALARRRPENADYRIELYAALSPLRIVLAETGRLDSAIAVGRRMVAGNDTLLRGDPRNAVLRRNLAVGYRALGRDLVTAGRPAEARDAQRRAVALCDSLVAADPTATEPRADLAFSLVLLAEAELAAGAAPAAVVAGRRAVAVASALRVADPSDAGALDRLVAARAVVGNARVALGEAAAGVGELRAAITLAEAALARTPENLGRRARVARHLTDLAAALERSDGRRPACLAWVRADSAWRATMAAAPSRPRPRDAERAGRGALRCGPPNA